jgi:hypothetical protein
MPIHWERIREFDPATVSADLWHTARHEAAHFLTAVHYGLVINGVWLRLPGVGNGGNILNRGSAGGVQVWDEPVAGDIVCTLAGTVADLFILGPDGCLKDAGFKNDLEHARETIKDAVRHPWYTVCGLYRGLNYVLTDDELLAMTCDFGREAEALLTQWWDVVERLAAAFLVCARRSKGSLHHAHVARLCEMTRYLLNGGDFQGWVELQDRPPPRGARGRAIARPFLQGRCR